MVAFSRMIVAVAVATTGVVAEIPSGVDTGIKFPGMGGDNSFAKRMAQKQGGSTGADGKLAADQAPASDAEHQFEEELKSHDDKEHDDVLKKILNMDGMNHEGTENMDHDDLLKQMFGGEGGDNNHMDEMKKMMNQMGMGDHFDEAGNMKKPKKFEDMTEEEQAEHKVEQEKSEKKRKRMEEIQKSNPLIKDDGTPDHDMLQRMMDPEFKAHEDPHYKQVIRSTLSMADEDGDGYLHEKEHDGFMGQLLHMFYGGKDHHAMKEHVDHHDEYGFHIEDLAHHIATQDAPHTDL